MSSWINLPYEILLLIFSNVDSSADLVQIQATCSTWYRASQECFYKTIDIRGGSISIAESLIKTLKSNYFSYRGQLVKRINMETLFLMEFTHQQGTVHTFESLIKLCPNLEILSAQHDSKFPFYQTIERNKHHLKFLQEIPRPTSYQEMQHYTRTALVFQKSLRHLYLGNVTTTALKDNRNSLVDQLCTFTVLQSLEVMAITHKNVFELENIINTCSPTLTNVIYTVYSNDISSSSHHSKENLSVLPLYKIKSFIGTNIVMTDATVNYIMHKFPNLTNLTIKSFNPNFIALKYQPEFKLSTPIVLKLFKYISAMKSFDLFGKLSNQDKAVEYVKNFYSNATSPLFLAIEYSNDMTPVHYPYFHIMKNTTQTYKNQYNNNNFDTTIIETGFLLDFNTANNSSSKGLPHKDIIRQFGSKIKGLQLSLRATQDFYIHNNSHVNSQFHTAIIEEFNAILLYCCKLKDLYLYDMYLSRNYDSKITFNTINRSIERLYIEASAILFKTLYQLSVCLPLLRCITFSSCDILETDTIKSLIICIDMPCTSFDTVVWKKKQLLIQQQEFQCYICIVIQDYYYYFRGDRIQLHDSTRQEFHNNKNNSALYRFKIHCQRIRSLVIELNNEFIIKYNFIINNDDVL